MHGEEAHARTSMTLQILLDLVLTSLLSFHILIDLVQRESNRVGIRGVIEYLSVITSCDNRLPRLSVCLAQPLADYTSTITPVVRAW